MKELREYIIEGMMAVVIGEPIGTAYMPNIEVIAQDILGADISQNDHDYWQIIYSNNHTDGIFESATVKIYTTIENHELLEQQEHVTRL